MNPADLALPAISPSLTAKGLALGSLTTKSGKAPVPRIDVEPIYTQLKSALGNQWQDYKTAINAFVLGNLNQSELTWVLQPLLSNAPTVITSSTALSPISITQLHNQLIICLFANICRDAPSTEVAPWVVATDKPSSAKNAAAIGASDKAEERLKKEVMALHARDRRRIKTLKADVPARPDGALKEMQDFKYELSACPPDTDGKSWDVESRRRYLQPLAQETLEFPSLTDMQQRIEPICSDEGLIASNSIASKACADFMEQAAEAFVKTVLGALQSHVRSNGTDCIQTAKFKTQLRHEESELERGTLQRSNLGLLPVEHEALTKRAPLGTSTLRIALELDDAYISQHKFLADKTRLDLWPAVGATDAWAVKPVADSDEMVIDDEPLWRGSTIAEQNNILNVLDDCLALA